MFLAQRYVTQPLAVLVNVLCFVQQVLLLKAGGVVCRSNVFEITCLTALTVGSAMLPVRQLQAGCPAARRSHAPSKAPILSSCNAWSLAAPSRTIERTLSLCVCASSSQDAAQEAVDPRSRQMQRAERRAARRRTTESQQAPSDDEEAESDADDDCIAVDETASSQPSRLSRIAARRAQRSRYKRRVPAALVPDEGIGDDEETEDEDAADLLVDSGLQQAGDADDAAEQEAEDEDFEDEGSQLHTENNNEPVTLPSSVLDAVVADRRSSHQRASTSQPSSGRHQARPDPVMLWESSPMYVPVLTDEDLDNDPPGHRSGYVAVIGRPNAGESGCSRAVVGSVLAKSQGPTVVEVCSSCTWEHASYPRLLLQCRKQ